MTLERLIISNLDKESFIKKKKAGSFTHTSPPSQFIYFIDASCQCFLFHTKTTFHSSPQESFQLSPVESFVPVCTSILIADDYQRVVKQRDSSSKYSYHNNLSQSGVENTRTSHRRDTEVPRSRKQT